MGENFHHFEKIIFGFLAMSKNLFWSSISEKAAALFDPKIYFRNFIRRKISPYIAIGTSENRFHLDVKDYIMVLVF